MVQAAADQQQSSSTAEMPQQAQKGLDQSSREQFRSLRGRDAQFGYRLSHHLLSKLGIRQMTASSVHPNYSLVILMVNLGDCSATICVSAYAGLLQMRWSASWLSRITTMLFSRCTLLNPLHVPPVYANRQCTVMTQLLFSIVRQLCQNECSVSGWKVCQSR